MNALSCFLSGSPPEAGAAGGPAPQAERERRRSAPAVQASRDTDESTFLELRRKVQAGELLSGSTERLLWKMKFNGHLTVVVQHGRVVKSGYEEGYFRRKNDLDGVILES